ncbi:hypothetical protein [Methanococcoides sp.]|uniref:hypothetical protein n=1 Tax=Methanococcoides sp. TaxID=1966350 RepID=UPI00272E4FB2|nr:hypothetical protein [Methanococcoides sp.]
MPEMHHHKTIKEPSIEEESALLRRIGVIATRNAVNDALSNGRPVTYQKGDKIVREYPDGTEEVLKTLDRPFVKLKQRVYRI